MSHRESSNWLFQIFYAIIRKNDERIFTSDFFYRLICSRKKLIVLWRFYVIIMGCVAITVYGGWTFYWGWKIVRLPLPDLGFASRVGRSGFFFYFGEGQSRFQGLSTFWYKLGRGKKNLFPRISLLWIVIRLWLINVARDTI